MSVFSTDKTKLYIFANVIMLKPVRDVLYIYNIIFDRHSKYQTRLESKSPSFTHSFIPDIVNSPCLLYAIVQVFDRFGKIIGRVWYSHRLYLVSRENGYPWRDQPSPDIFHNRA